MSVTEEQFIVNTICLPNQNQTEQSKYATVAGWGVTSLDESVDISKTLQEAKFIILNEHQCKTVCWESIALFSPEEIGVNASLLPSLDEWRNEVQHNIENRICLMASVPPGTGRKQTHTTIFQGDSGSPMVQYFDSNRAHAMGINSWGYQDLNTNPLMFLTKVSMYIDWIRDKLKQL